MIDRNPNANRSWLLILGPAALLLLLTWVIIALDLDRRVAARFFDPSRGWYLARTQPWHWLYHYGTIPGIALAVSALAGWFWSYTSERFRRLHRCFLVIVLTAILGPGVLVNGILKNYWSRPRPREVQEFNGSWAYRHVHQPGIPGKGESFPCGHCTMGFFFCSLLVFRRHRPWLAYTGAAAGISLGALLSIARIVQGAHYLSDTLWSMGIMLLLPLALFLAICQKPAAREQKPKTVSRSKSVLLWLAFAVCLILMLGGFLLHRPFYKDHITRVRIPPPVKRVVLQVNTEIQSSTVRFLDIDTPRIVLSARGFAWIGAGHRLRQSRDLRDGRLWLDFVIEPSGYYSELTHDVVIQMPVELKNQIEFEIVDLSK